MRVSRDSPGRLTRGAEMRDKRTSGLPGRPAWRLALLAAVVAAVGAFAVAAMTAAGAGGGHHARSGQARSERFRACMTAHGVKPPREQGRRPSRAKLDRALAACRRYLPRRAQQDLRRMNQ